jgi:hypothetical protein
MSHPTLAFAKIGRLHEPFPEQVTLQVDASHEMPGSFRHAFGPVQAISQVGASQVTPRGQAKSPAQSILHATSLRHVTPVEHPPSPQRT